MRRHLVLPLAALVTATLGLQPAHAGGGGIVLESHTGPRSDDAGRLLSPILEELAVRGFVGGYDAVGRKFEREVSRAAISAEGLPTEFADQVERGQRAWIGGHFDEAVTVLAPMVDAALANPGAFAQNQPLRDRLLKALVALALSQQRMGDPSAARTTFGEILRSYPDTLLSRAVYGPDAFTLFEEVRKDAGSHGRARLTVKPSSEAAVVFINESFGGVNVVTRTDLVPGDYRVYLQAGTTLSRSHRVSLGANAAAELSIELPFDEVIRTTPKWTGLQFKSAADRERLEALFAARFANEIGAAAIAVIGIDKVGGHRVIVGSLVNLSTGREIRRASVAVDPDPPVERLRSLARFLAGEEAAHGVDVQLNAPAPTPDTAKHDGAKDDGAKDDGAPRGDHGDDRPPGWGGWKYVAGGAAIVAIGVGATLVALDGKCSSTAAAGGACPDVYSTAVPGYVGLGVGVALGGLSAYLFLHKTGRGEPRTAYVAPTSDGVVAGYAGRF